MTFERKLLWTVVAGLAVLAVLLLTSEGVRERLGPTPLAAHVAIEVGGSGVAETGPVSLEAGTPFTLHAILEAEGLGGARRYFSEAPRLRIGGEEVVAESPRRWELGDELRILWFTVEGFTPYLEIDAPEEFERFRFEELFRADWAQSWSVPGSVEPADGGRVTWRRDLGLSEFGTQRYHVRIEIFGPESRIVPRHRLRSAGAADLPAAAAAFATVVADLDGGLALPSRCFGLTQMEFLGERLGGLAPRFAALSRQNLAFSRATLLREMLDAAGLAWEDLAWSGVDLAAGPAWGAGGVAPGDLLRVGERIVVVVRDLGEAGRLDYADLGFDFQKGPHLRPLRDVFTGEGLVEWAPLGRSTEG